MEILSDPMNLPSSFWEYAIQKWLADAPVFPISQVFGFTQFTATPATSILTAETTVSTTYTDLATVGPTLTGLADGNYAIFFGAFLHNDTAGGGAVMSVKVNSTEASDNDFTSVFPAGSSAYPTGGTCVSRVIFKALSNNGSNTLTCRYREAAPATGTAKFSNRWLAALKYSNL